MANKNKDLLKTGIRNIPVEKGFSAVHYHFGYSLDKKDVSKIAKQYVKKNYSKEDATAILANAEWNFTAYTGLIAAAYCMDNGIKISDPYSNYPLEVVKYFDNLIAKGKGVLRTKAVLEEAKVEKKVYTPQQRLAMKINDTVMRDIDTLEDEWYEGQKTDLDIVSKMRIHELKGMAVNPVVEYLKRMLPEYEDAHSGACKDAKAAYAHLGKRELTRRIKVINNMINDLLKWKEDQKTRRKRKTA